MVPQQRSARGHAPTPDRDPVIDLVRFFCLALVVVAHTMMVSPVLHPDGTVTTENILGNQHWFEPVVWVLQIMPLFFVAGGITGLQSWRRLRARGGNAFDFMQGRLLRLIRPAAVLLAIMFIALSAARLAGVDPQVIELLTSGAGMPLWFLAAYLAAQLNLPWLAACHARAPWLTLAGLASLVVTVDCLRGVLPPLAYLNMVFLWCAVQQLGFILADSPRLLRGRPAHVGIMIASNMLLGLIVLLGLYSGNMLVVGAAAGPVGRRCAVAPGAGAVWQAGGAADGVRPVPGPPGGRRAAGRRRRFCPGSRRGAQRAHAGAPRRGCRLLRPRRRAPGADSRTAHSASWPAGRI